MQKLTKTIHRMKNLELELHKFSRTPVILDYVGIENFFCRLAIVSIFLDTRIFVVHIADLFRIYFNSVCGSFDSIRSLKYLLLLLSLCCFLEIPKWRKEDREWILSSVQRIIGCL